MITLIRRAFPLAAAVSYTHLDVYKRQEFDSFHDNLLEYPQYSRPEVWRGKAVPPILMSGHHANVEKWRREQSQMCIRDRNSDGLRGIADHGIEY